MNTIQFPVFVRLKDCGDVVRHDSFAKMQSDLEQIDIENDEYEAWDAAGTQLKLSVQESDEWLRLDPLPKSQPDQLAEVIMAFARREGVDADAPKLCAGDFSGAFEQI